jgi:hypothetical protein
LFQKHDALKSGYRRERATNLDIYEFSKLFSAFCAITYEKRAFRFSDVDAVSYAKMAMRVAGTPEVDPAGFLTDAKQAVCLLVDDGLDVAFVHRSFQEYFVAKFINDCDDDLQKKYIRKVCASDSPFFEVDNVLKILHEMSPGIVEENFLIPGLSRFFGKYKDRKVSVATWKILFKKLFASVQINEGGYLNYLIRNSKDISIFLFVRDNCFSEPRRRRAELAGEDLIALFDGRKDIELNTVGDRSLLWRELAVHAGDFSVVNFERTRGELISMRERVGERAAAIDDIFSFGE